NSIGPLHCDDSTELKKLCDDSTNLEANDGPPRRLSGMSNASADEDSPCDARTQSGTYNTALSSTAQTKNSSRMYNKGSQQSLREIRRHGGNVPDGSDDSDPDERNSH